MWKPAEIAESANLNWCPHTFQIKSNHHTFVYMCVCVCVTALVLDAPTAIQR